MIQVVAGIYLFVGIGGLIGSLIYALQTDLSPFALYLGAASLGSLVLGLILNTLGDLSETTRTILTVLLSDPADKPTQCPKCNTLLMGKERFGKCHRCDAKLPMPRERVGQDQSGEASGQWPKEEP